MNEDLAFKYHPAGEEVKLYRKDKRKGKYSNRELVEVNIFASPVWGSEECSSRFMHTGEF
jgi:hypothetical protein